MKDDGTLESGEALVEHEMHGLNEDCEMGHDSAREAMWHACTQLNSDAWEESRGKEKIKLIREFMDNNKSIHADPSVISAKMICTALYGVQRQLKEIKHHLMGVSEEDS